MKRRDFFTVGAAAGLACRFSSQANAFGSEDARTAGQTSTKTPLGTPGRIDRERLRGRNINRSTVVCRNGVAATSQSIASTVGVDILKSGGNAIDAAIATSAMMSVVEPMSCGPGGDLFAILWVEADKKIYGLNASGRSPYGWSREKAKECGYDNSLPGLGPHTWSVPGCVSGWDALQRRFGKLSFRDVLAPAAEYAREGFPVTEIITEYFRGSERDFENFPNAAQTYLIDGNTPEFGQIFANPDISRFFEILMRDGAEAF
ncbi:MAG: gamma-glutamyltransferase, partial [bacterium]